MQLLFCRLSICILLMIVLSVGTTSALAADEPTVLGSPVTGTATGHKLPGKLIWVDLVTTDIDKAASFYSHVFGWSVVKQDAGYLELAHAGVPVSSVVLYDGDEAVEGDARWLVSVSVDNVDATAARVSQANGEVLESATDFPDRGRYALVQDSRGAELMLLDATGGDPLDDEIEVGTWTWAELWTDDIDESVRFYKQVADYQATEVVSADGDEQTILSTDGKARASVVKLPWDTVEPNWVPYVAVENASNAIAKVREAGGGVIAALPADDASVLVALIEDPTGGVFAIQQVEVEK